MVSVNIKPAFDCIYCHKGFKGDTFLNCPHCGKELPKEMALKEKPLVSPAEPTKKPGRIKMLIRK